MRGGPDSYPRPATLAGNSPGDLDFYGKDCWRDYARDPPPARRPSAPPLERRSRVFGVQFTVLLVLPARLF